MTTLLLLQARNPGDPMADHEVRCFADALGIPMARVRPWDLLGGPPDEAALADSAGLLVGGSGDYSVLDDTPWLRAFFDFLTDVVVDRSIPTFASCFGFQGLVVAGGGEVVHDPDRAEVGTFDVCLTDDGRTDPLLGPLAPTFPAQLGHKDRAARLPSGMTHLARSARSDYQALRVGDGPIVATQFHPELDRAANRLRYLAYLEHYGGSADEATDPVLRGLRETPEAAGLLPRWLREVEAGGRRGDPSA